MALAAGVLAACGSSADEATSETGDATFCVAVGDYVEASETGDRTQMADALDGTVDGLPEDAAKTVSAYVAALRSAPANEAPDGDGVESDATDEAFRAYVADACGDEVQLPEELDATTTEPPPAGTGGGGTDDTTVDGGPVGGGGDTGTDGGAGVP